MILPTDKTTGKPLWVEVNNTYVVKCHGAEIIIPKPRKNAKKVKVQLTNGPAYEVKPEKVNDCCRFLVKLRNKAGADKIWTVLIDTPDKGRHFVSNQGFRWLTNPKGEIV